MSTEYIMRDSAIKYALQTGCGSEAIIFTAEKILEFLKGPPATVVQVRTAGLTAYQSPSVTQD